MAGEIVLVRGDGNNVVHLATRAPGVLVVYPPACGATAIGWHVVTAADGEMCRVCVQDGARQEVAQLREVQA